MTRISLGGDRPDLDVPDDVAAALHDALTNARQVTVPTETNFDDLLTLISRTTRLITHLSLSREVAIAEADATSPSANRRAIGKAAAMVPSQLGDVLERNGRPRSRRDGTVLYDWDLEHGVETGSVRATDDDEAAELALRDSKTVRRGDEDETETGDPMALVIRRRGHNTGADNWIQYDAEVLYVYFA
ncbi:hypothetical protein ACWFRT_13800 [Streptomyces anulatus]